MIKFDALVIDSQALYKVVIKDDMKSLFLWAINFNSNNFDVDFYTLKKVSSESEQINIHTTTKINSQQFSQLFGFEINEIWYLLNEREKIYINYILINSVKLNFSNFHNLSKSYIEDKIKIIQEQSCNLFKFNFVKKGFVKVSLEYIYFNSNCHFYLLKENNCCKKIIQTEFVKANNNLVDDKELVRGSIPWTSKKLKDKKFRELLKRGIVKLLSDLTNSENLKLFESFFNILEYIK